MLHSVVQTSSAKAIANAIRTQSLMEEGYVPPNVQTLINNQASSDDNKIREAISLLLSYKKLGVNCYDDELKFILANKDKRKSNG